MHTFINDSNYDVRTVYDWRRKKFIFFRKPNKIALPAAIILALGTTTDMTPTGAIARNRYWENSTKMSGVFSYLTMFSSKEMILSIALSAIILGVFWHLLFQFEVERSKMNSGSVNTEKVIDSAFSALLKAWQIKTKDEYKKYMIRSFILSIFVFIVGFVLFELYKSAEIDNVYTAVLVPVLVVTLFSICVWMAIDVIPKFYLVYKWIKANMDAKGNIIFFEKEKNNDQ